MADGLRVTKDATGRRRAVSTAALLAAGAAVGIVAALWLFDGDTLEGGRQRAGGAVGGAAVPGRAADVGGSVPPGERVVTHTRRVGTPKAETSAPADQADAETEPEIGAAEYIEALRAAGETGGIAAFNPPGTDPLKKGIIVPDDYELPEGYARRYQMTDDGQELPPILMFSPDFEFLDPSGKPIPLPDDLIVPPEMAPPDLPIRTLEPGEHGSR